MAKEKKLQIIKAAEKRFARHGIHKTSLNEIARDLRIGKASIYHYFESKDELYIASVEYEVNLLLEDIKTIFTVEESKIEETLTNYLLIKEAVPQKYSMIYDTILFLLKDSGFENENALVKSLLEKEEVIIKEALLSGFKSKIVPLNPKLPSFIVNLSWGMLFALKFNLMTNAGSKDQPAILLKKAIEKILDN